MGITPHFWWFILSRNWHRWRLSLGLDRATKRPPPRKNKTSLSQAHPQEDLVISIIHIVHTYSILSINLDVDAIRMGVYGRVYRSTYLSASLSAYPMHLYVNMPIFPNLSLSIYAGARGRAEVAQRRKTGSKSKHL